MMLPNLSELKEMRNELGLSTQQLSRALNIPERTILMIEGGKTCRSYVTIKKIFDFLEASKAGDRRTVREITNTGIVWGNPTMKVKEAMGVLLERGFSQLPVKDKFGRVVGIVGEKKLLDAKNGGEPIMDFLSDDFIIVDGQMPARIARDLLKHLSVILVNDRGSVSGIVTRSDYLKSL